MDISKSLKSSSQREFCHGCPFSAQTTISRNSVRSGVVARDGRDEDLSNGSHGGLDVFLEERREEELRDTHSAPHRLLHGGRRQLMDKRTDVHEPTIEYIHSWSVDAVGEALVDGTGSRVTRVALSWILSHSYKIDELPAVCVCSGGFGASLHLSG